MPKSKKRKPRVGVQTVSAAEALEYAVQLHKSGKPDLAEIIYQRILAAAPEQPDALQFYAILKHQTGRSAEAVAMIRRAIAREPGHAGMHNNLGNIFTEQDDAAQAASAYRAAIGLDPDHVEAHGNLGVALRKLGQLDEAEASYRKAVALNPAYREGHNNLGRLLASRGRIKEAIASLARAMELQPHDAETRRMLASTYAACGEDDNALKVLDSWLADEPESPSALHLRAAISGENIPARAPDRYIQTFFDSFAPSFDAKLAKLEYRAPDLVADALGRARGTPCSDLVILDAGCGTGLCAPLLAPFAARLIGVDLSRGMLDLARHREAYAELVEAELTRYLADHPASFDAIVSADTLCYFGDLHEVIAKAADALSPGGLLVFTVEAESGPAPFRINPHGRYSHRSDHVGRVLAASGLAVVAQEEASLRMERGEPVPGLVITARASSEA